MNCDVVLKSIPACPWIFKPGDFLAKMHAIVVFPTHATYPDHTYLQDYVPLTTSHKTNVLTSTKQ